MSVKFFTNALKVTLGSAIVGTGIDKGYGVKENQNNLPLEHRGSHLRRSIEVANAFFFKREQEFRRGDIGRSQGDHARLVASLAAPSEETPRIRKISSDLVHVPNYSSMEEVLKVVPKTTPTSLPVFVSDTETYITADMDGEIVFRGILTIEGYHHDVLSPGIRKKIIDERYMQCLSPARVNKEAVHYILIGSDCNRINARYFKEV